MPAHSAINQLPPEIRRAADKELVRRAFGNYDGFVKWMKETHGVDISKSAAHRHGQKLQTKLDAIRVATEQAEAIVSECDDAKANVSDALVRLAQERVFNFLIQAEEVESAGDLNKLAAAASTLTRAAVLQKQHADAVAKKAAAAAETVRGMADIPSETAEKVRRLILGLGGANDEV